MEISTICDKIEKRRKDHRKAEQRYVISIIVLGVIFIILLFLLSNQRWIISLILFVLGALFFFLYARRSFEVFNEVRLTNEEIISWSLAKISDHIDKYIKNPTIERSELVKAKKSFDWVFQRLKLSISLYNNPLILNKDKKIQLIKLRDYLNTIVKKAIRNILTKQETIQARDDLRKIALYFYKDKNIKLNELLDKKSLNSPLLDKFYNIFTPLVCSYIISLAILGGIFIFVVLRFGLLNQIGGIDIILNILLIYLEYSAFSKLQRAIQWILESIYLFFIPFNMDKK